jgi:sigma-E factor negative regulatory protein RseA
MVNDGVAHIDPNRPVRRGWGPWSQTKIMQISSNQASGPQRQALSALMDGDLPAGDLAGVIARFRDDGELRADWHAYHLIGDVLRSDELAAAPARDAGFLQALRHRLDQAPQRADTLPLVAAALPVPTPGTPMSAAPVPALPGRRWLTGWLIAPAAVAAGFVVLAGVLVVNKTLVSPPWAADAVMAQRTPPAGVLVRDARLDRYLAAHRNLGTGLAGTGAGGAERTVQIVYEPK